MGNYQTRILLLRLFPRSMVEKQTLDLSETIPFPGSRPDGQRQPDSHPAQAAGLGGEDWILHMHILSR